MLTGVSGITKRFGRTVALAGASANVEGKVNLVLGPNGSGKTTLLNVLAGLTYPEKGVLRLDGEEYDVRDSTHWLQGVQSLRRMSGFLLDKPGLPGSLDGYELLESVANSFDMPPDATWINNLVSRLDMLSYIHWRIADYSSGMAQKLSIVASLVRRPRLVIWDEPTSNLDARTRSQLAGVINTMVAQGSVFLIATHAPYDFESVSDWIAIMELGRIEYAGKLSDASDSPIFQVRSGAARKLAASLMSQGFAVSVNLPTPDTVTFHASEKGLQFSDDPVGLSLKTGCEVVGLTRVRRPVAEIQAEILQKEAGRGG